MVTKEEFGQLISEFESLRDMVMEELTKIKTEVETIKEDFEDLRKELEGSAKISLKRKIG